MSHEVVALSNEVVDEVVLEVCDSSPFVDDVSVMVADVDVDEVETEVDEETVDSVDADEEVSPDSVEVVTTDVVDATVVDSLGMRGLRDMVDRSVKVELSFWRIIAAPIVEPLRVRPSTTRVRATKKIPRSLVATSNSPLPIHLSFLGTCT